MAVWWAVPEMFCSHSASSKAVGAVYDRVFLETKPQQRLEIPRSRHASRCDLTEAGRIDVQRRIPEDRLVQDIPRIRTELNAARFADLYRLAHAHIETKTAGTFHPARAKIADPSGCRILNQNVTLRIGDRS